MIQHSSRGVQYVTCVMLHFTVRQWNVGLIKESLCVLCETNKKWQNSETGQHTISWDRITTGENRCNYGYVLMDWSSTWHVWEHENGRWLICDSWGYQGLYPFEIIPLQTTRKENNWKTEEALARAAVTLETERIKGSNPWCLWWWPRTWFVCVCVCVCVVVCDS